MPPCDSPHYERNISHGKLGVKAERSRSQTLFLSQGHMGLQGPLGPPGPKGEKVNYHIYSLSLIAVCSLIVSNELWRPGVGALLNTVTLSCTLLSLSAWSVFLCIETPVVFLISAPSVCLVALAALLK